MRYVTEDQANMIRKAIAGGKSQRKAAEEAGVSQETARAVIRGNWKPFEKVRPYSREFVSPTKLEAVARCPGCGGLVTMPCRKCRAAIERLAGPVYGTSEAVRPLKQGTAEEVCGTCGEGEPKTSGRGLICSVCDSAWAPSPALTTIRARRRVERKRHFAEKKVS